MINTDCRHFRGDIPCKPHKSYNVHCDNCSYYDKTDSTILIIKLGAIGDVIRTTPLLRKIKEQSPSSRIFWVTYTPEILPKGWIDNILSVSLENIELLKSIEFDWLINLDKDPIAISLTNAIKAKRKSGFTIDTFGHAKPIDTEAENHKWVTGLFDDLNKQNTKHYVQEIFEICGYEFNKEEYLIDIPEKKIDFEIDHTKKVVGLNTGCGGRWTSRLWPEEHWVELTQLLIRNNYEVVLLGGQQEHEKNLRIQQLSGAKYPGHFPLSDFINLINECDIVVTAVTMAMHITIALKKNLILFNNIFNKNEFYLYGLGVIIEPEKKCQCFFTPICTNNDYSCMEYLRVKTVMSEIKNLIKG